MLKLVYCISRRPDLSREEFRRYWRDVHGGIGARIPGLRRLVHSYAVHVPGDAHQPDFDGMAELWFDDAASLLAARQSPEWRASTADEAHFIDHGRVAYLVTEELDFPLPPA
jgi:uncharacterized protein (TIGR02118 family)